MRHEENRNTNLLREEGTHKEIKEMENIMKKSYIEISLAVGQSGAKSRRSVRQCPTQPHPSYGADSSGCMSLFRHPNVSTSQYSDKCYFCRNNEVSEQWDSHYSEYPLLRQPIIPTSQYPTIIQQYSSYCNVLFIIILDLIFGYRVTVEV